LRAERKDPRPNRVQRRLAEPFVRIDFVQPVTTKVVDDGTGDAGDVCAIALAAVLEPCCDPGNCFEAV
jgi:hypothetical protein